MNQIEREYGVVLGGGGTRGAYQVGAWQALQEMNIKVKCVCGCSIGALNAALFIQGDIEYAKTLYNNIKITDIMEIDKTVNSDKNIFNIANLRKLATQFTKAKGISNEPLKNTIEKYIDIDKVYNSDIDFGLVALNTVDKTAVKLYKNEIKKEEFVDYLLASSCFPIFKKQKIGDKEFVDGGLCDSIPINMALQKGYKNVIVLDIEGIGVKRKLISKDTYLKIISPSDDLGGTFEFNQQKIKNNIKLGYLDTLRAFNKLQGHIYYFDNSEFNKMIEYYGLQTIYGLEYAAQLYQMDKLKIYTFEEFILELRKRHKTAQLKYAEFKQVLKGKNIIEMKKKLKILFDKGLGLCFATDLYLDKPMSKKFAYMEYFMKEYIRCVKALLELV